MLLTDEKMLLTDEKILLTDRKILLTTHNFSIVRENDSPFQKPMISQVPLSQKPREPTTHLLPTQHKLAELP